MTNRVVVTTSPRTRLVISPAGRPQVVVRPPAARRVTITPVGSPGLSAYELAVGAGFAGTLEQWLASLRADSAGFIATFPSAAAQWSIPHAFPRTPNVQVVVDGRVVLADVEHLPGLVVVTHAEPTAGMAVLT